MPVCTTENYVTYSGSLTTPSCDESVSWALMLSPIKIKAMQVREKYCVMSIVKIGIEKLDVL